MMPMWFLLFFAFCAGWAGSTAMRILRSDDVYIAGYKAKRLTTALALTIILVGLGIMAAISFGFIPDHAP